MKAYWGSGGIAPHTINKHQSLWGILNRKERIWKIPDRFHSRHENCRKFVTSIHVNDLLPENSS
jgi:hypothetical protein